MSFPCVSSTYLPRTCPVLLLLSHALQRSNCLILLFLLWLSLALSLCSFCFFDVDLGSTSAWFSKAFSASSAVPSLQKPSAVLLVSWTLSDRLCGSTNNVSCVCAWATHSLPSRAPVYCGCPAGTHRCVTMSRVTS